MDKQSGFERHAQTVFAGLALAAICWGAATLVSMKAERGEDRVRLERLLDDVDKVQSQVDKSIAMNGYASDEVAECLQAIRPPRRKPLRK